MKRIEELARHRIEELPAREKTLVKGSSMVDVITVRIKLTGKSSSCRLVCLS